MIRQGNVIKPVDPDNDNGENYDQQNENRRTLIRQYSDPTPQQNQSEPDSLESSATSAKKSKYLSVTNSHLQKQNSDSALTLPHEGQQPTLLTDLINDPLKFQVKRLREQFDVQNRFYYIALLNCSTLTRNLTTVRL